MAKITLKEGADPLKVAEALRKIGIVLHRSIGENRYVAFIPRKKWLCMMYPELIPLYEQDRAFWRDVRKRTRNGEEVDPAEIYAHGQHFNEQFDLIMKKYERRKENPVDRGLSTLAGTDALHESGNSL